MFTSLLKYIIKETDVQPDEETHRKRAGRVLSTGASVPVQLECTVLPVWTWELPGPHATGILCRHHHVGMIDH